MVTINLISQNSCERFTVVFLLPNMSCLSSAWSARTCSSCNFGDLFPILIWDFFLTAHLSIVASWLGIAVKQGNIIAGSLFLLSIYCNIIAECLAFCEDLGAVPISLSLDSVVTFNSNLSTTHYLHCRRFNRDWIMMASFGPKTSGVQRRALSFNGNVALRGLKLFQIEPQDTTDHNHHHYE